MLKSSIKPLNCISRQLLNNTPVIGKLLRFIVLGDTHIIASTTGELGKNASLYNKILFEVNFRKDNNSFNPNFIIHGGDVVDKGDDQASFELFYQLTYDELIHKGVPVFISIGNHDYDITKSNPDFGNFRRFIGKTRDEVHIPGTKVIYIYLNTHYCSKRSSLEPALYSYFSSKKNEDIDFLKKMNSSNLYLIDFHNPFRFKECNDIIHQDDNYYLQWHQKKLFRNSVNSNVKVCAIFSHHMHTMKKFKFDFNNHPSKVPFLISGKGGNCSSTNNYGSYYEVTLDMSTSKIEFNQITIPI